MSAPNGSVGSQSGGWNCWPPQTGGCGQGVQGGCATYHQGLKTGVCQGWGGGGGLHRILRHQPGGGGHQRGQWETLRGVGGGGGDGTNTLAASWGGGTTGQTRWRHPRGGGGGKHHGGIPPGGGGGTNTLVQPHYPNPTKSVNPAGARGGKARDNNQGETGGGDSKEM